MHILIAVCIVAMERIISIAHWKNKIKGGEGLTR